MSANTDKFIKGARRWTGQIGASGVADASVTTIPLVSTTSLPSDTAVQITIDRVDANGNLTPTKEEVIRGVVSGSNVIDAVRGVEGTAQAHNAGSVVEVILTADQHNRQVDALLEEHNQDGSHKDITADSLVISSVTWANLIKGWQEAGETWTYASATTFTIAETDLTSKYTKGTKIKLTNDGSTKYFYVVSSSFSTDTTVTVTGEADLVSGAITNPFYSYNDCPQDFKKGIIYYKASAYRNTNQNINDGTPTKVQLSLEHYDINSNFDSTTNYRYTAPVTGYYSVSGIVRGSSGTGKIYGIDSRLYKNGSSFFIGSTCTYTASTGYLMNSHLSTDMYLEKGDYIELYAVADTSDNSAQPISGSMSISFISI